MPAAFPTATRPASPTQRYAASALPLSETRIIGSSTARSEELGRCPPSWRSRPTSSIALTTLAVT